MNKNPRKTYDYTGNLVEEAYLLETKYHRIDGPAVIGYYRSGQISCEQYWQNGKVHNVNGPAAIEYSDSGIISATRFYINDIHLPSLEKFNTPKENLFYYIQKYPKYIKEIELLARHSNWLNEKELELLSCMDMFHE